MKKILRFIGLVVICNSFIFEIVYAQHNAAMSISGKGDQSMKKALKADEKALVQQEKITAVSDKAEVAQEKADIAAQKASESKIKAKDSAAAANAAAKADKAAAKADNAAAKADNAGSSAASADRGGTRDQATEAGGHGEATADICKQKPELPRCANGGTK